MAARTERGRGGAPAGGRERAGFSLAQFRVLFHAIRKGEARVDASGMGMSLGGEGKRRGRLGTVAHKALMGFAYLVMAALFFGMGTTMGAAGMTPYATFSVMVVSMVVLTLLVGLYQAVNVLYFVRDLGYYLALPLSPTVVMWAKLAHFLLVTVAGDMVVLLPVGFGCLWAQGAPAAAFAAMLAAFVLCAVAVNLALVIVCVPLLRFSRIARDKDKFSRTFGMLITVLALAIGVGVQFAVRGDGLTSLASGIGGLASGGVSALVMAVLCPPVMAARLVMEGGPLEVAGGFVAMLALVGLYAALLSFVARRWYFEGVRALAGAGGEKSSRRYGVSELRSVAGVRSRFAATLACDWKTMARTPAFFNQFVLSPVLMPLYLVAIMVVSMAMQMGRSGLGLGETLGMVRTLAEGVTFGSDVLVLCALGTLGVAAFMGLASYSFTMAVSRDGSDFFYLRALPMDWRAYLLAKFVPTELLSGVPMLVVLVAALLVVGMPAASVVFLAALYMAATWTLHLLSLGFGACFPRLSWDNEAQLTKGGATVAIVYAGLLAALVVMALPALVTALPLLSGAVSPAAGPFLGLAAQLVECAGIACWVLGPCARSLSRREP